MPPSRKISPSGEVVVTDDVSSESSLLSGGRYIDVFGFNLHVRQFLVTLALVYLMLGPKGSKSFQTFCKAMAIDLKCFSLGQLPCVLLSL